MARFSDIESFAINVANAMFADINQKEKVRDSIIESVVAVAIQYSHNPKLKREIDEYAKYMSMKNKFER